MTRGCLAGSGVCFVSHRGSVQPCGYLPLEAGDLRKQSFREIWEQSALFEDLRDLENLTGKCGICEFKQVCLGCRARAYGMTGDFPRRRTFLHLRAARNIEQGAIRGMPTVALKHLSEPDGRRRHVFVVCVGENCSEAGSASLLALLRQTCRQAGGDLRVASARCVGHCELAPVMVEDGRVMGAVSRRRLQAEFSRLGLNDPAA